MTDKTKPAPTVWRPIANLVAAAVGLGLLTAGAALIYRPAGFLVPGVLLLAGGVAGALRSSG